MQCILAFSVQEGWYVNEILHNMLAPLTAAALSLAYGKRGY